MMEQRLEAIRNRLSKMASHDATGWILENYPVEMGEYGDAITLIAHLSFKKADQIRLAKHYLQRVPFATSRVYDVFSSFMSLKLFISIVGEFIPNNEADKNLMLYHLTPVLEKSIKTARDREIVAALISKVRLS